MSRKRIGKPALYTRPISRIFESTASIPSIVLTYMIGRIRSAVAKIVCALPMPNQIMLTVTRTTGGMLIRDQRIGSSTRPTFGLSPATSPRTKPARHPSKRAMPNRSSVIARFAQKRSVRNILIRASNVSTGAAMISSCDAIESSCHRRRKRRTPRMP